VEKIKRTFGFIFTHPLGKRHPVRVFSRLVWWPIQSSIRSSELMDKPYLSGIYLYTRKGLTGFTGNIYAGLPGYCRDADWGNDEIKAAKGFHIMGKII
jgi:hypothetical protein